MKKILSLFSILFSLVLLTTVSSNAAVRGGGQPAARNTHTEVHISYTTNGFTEGASVTVDGKRVGGVSRNARPFVIKLQNDKTYKIELHFRGPRGTWKQTKTIHIPYAQSIPITINSNDGGISSSVDKPSGPRRLQR